MMDEELAQLQGIVYGDADRPVSHLRNLPARLALHPASPGSWAKLRRWPVELARYLPGDVGIAIVRETTTREFIPSVLVTSGSATGQLFVLTDQHGVPAHFVSGAGAQDMIETRLAQGGRRRRNAAPGPASAVHALLPPGRSYDWRLLTPYVENVMFPHRKPKPLARPIEPALVEPALHGMSLEDGLRFAATIYEINHQAGARWFREDPRRVELVAAEAEQERQALREIDRAHMRALFSLQEQIDLFGTPLPLPGPAPAAAAARQDLPPAMVARALVMLIQAAARLLKHTQASRDDCMRIIEQVVSPPGLPGLAKLIEEISPDGWLLGTRTAPPSDFELRFIMAELVDCELDHYPWLLAELEGVRRALRSQRWCPSLDGIGQAIIRDRLGGTAPADLKELLESWAYGLNMTLEVEGQNLEPSTKLRLAGCEMKRH